MSTLPLHDPLPARPNAVALLRAAGCLLACAALAACATRTQLAPVEERKPIPVGPAAAAAAAAPANGTAATAGAGATAAAPAAPAAPAGAASAAEPVAARAVGDSAAGATYTVKPGDTLVRIGLETGQNWRDIARWNNIDNPNVLEVGHVLRVSPPPAEANVATTRPVAPPPRIESRPLDTRPVSPPGSASTPTPAAAATPGAAATPAATAAATPAPAPAPATAPAATALPPAPPAAAALRETEGDIAWAWPASGPVAAPFDELRSKGLSFAGKAGDPVLAAADGRVVYAGSGLRGYGNLVIVKHNATYLTAYAHNQTLLVKEDQVVRRGQKIAEMGSSDSDRVQLHFEVRRLGKPVDPAKVLPPR
ncbi:MAG: peptidoglycan DD-metalloendopeptidase family protein [Rubrivivax sp.]|nr:peptidoglycan DD-metalloendopeptidase family protein [Rubrivivax sp.]